jgi:hypothetical protein
MAKARKVDPDLFKNKEAVEKYNRLGAILHSYKQQFASDGTELNMLTIPHHFRKKIEHLPKSEQELLTTRFNRFTDLKLKLGKLKYKFRAEVKGNYDAVLEIRKAEVLELFARHYSPEEIHKKMVEDTGIDINFNSIKRFALKYKEEIEREKEDWAKNHNSVSISKKRSRLEQLDDYLRILNLSIQQASTNEKMLPFIREARGTLEQARKEVEGNNIKLDINGQIDINATIALNHSVERIYSDINFMNLLISRVAARMRVNPLLLQYQLTNSWYARFTGIKRNDNLMDEEPDYPSKIILNWNELQEKNVLKESKLDNLKKEYEDAVEVTSSYEEKVEAKSLKERMKQKLREREEYLDGAEQRIKGK